MEQRTESDKDNPDAKDKQKDLAGQYAELDFDCEYSDNLPKLLHTLNISLAFTSYQAGRLMLIRSKITTKSRTGTLN